MTSPATDWDCRCGTWLGLPARDVYVCSQRCHSHGKLSNIDLWTRHLQGTEENPLPISLISKLHKCSAQIANDFRKFEKSTCSNMLKAQHDSLLPLASRRHSLAPHQEGVDGTPANQRTMPWESTAFSFHKSEAICRKHKLR